MSMAEHRSEVCIGGPHDGRRVKSNNENRFTVALRPPLAATSYVGPVVPEDSVAVNYVTYVRQAIHVSGESVSYWVPEGQPELVAIERLLAGYRP